jgi:cell division protein FtsQ
VAPEQIELYPRIGKHVIELGSTENFRNKLNRLRIFYQEGLERVGWNKYKTISLAYDDQIVCTKEHNKKTK